MLVVLTRALILAEPAGYVRRFADEGAPMAELLRQARARGIAPAYIERLLAAFAETTHAERGMIKQVDLIHPSSFIIQSLVEPLTARELELLGLIVAGASNRDIAQRLMLSVGTIKRYVSNILGKLDVESRTQAIAKARALRLVKH